MNFKRVKITTTVPPDDASRLREALGKAGAGVIGDYSFCSFSIMGEGRSLPNSDADPHIGKPHELAVIKEVLIDVTCDRTSVKKVVAALRENHPYEEPIVEITPLLDPNDF